MRIALLGLVVFSLLHSSAAAQRLLPEKYGRTQASQEAYQLHEQQRQFRIGQQLYLNEEMLLLSRPWTPSYYFAEPGTFLPPNFFGYSLAEPPINQPIGRVEYKIGQNRTLSRPVYADEQVILQRGKRFGSGPREF